MLKVLSVPQIREADAYTIENEPVASIDLMERASSAFCQWFTNHFSPHKKILIFCGVGNNGGDGLAIARILKSKSYSVDVVVIGDVNKASKDFKGNLNRWGKSVLWLNHINDMNAMPQSDVVIDAMFGSGLARPLERLYAEAVAFINRQDGVIVSVDIASGLFADQHNTDQEFVVKPHFTVAFQVPKLAFLLPQNHPYVGEWHLANIGLSEAFISEQKTNYHFIESGDITSRLKKRGKYDHKGTNGKGIIYSGSYGKMGAAVLAAKAALRSGIGLLTMYIPRCGYEVMQISVPEAMTITDAGQNHITATSDADTFDVIGIGPGIGTAKETVEAVKELVAQSDRPMVIDADALNIISRNREILEIIPKLSILTPHVKEFNRLVGDWNNDYERLAKQQQFSASHNVIVVLKGAHTSISTPDGNVYFNSTGNPGMGTGGSGDVLLGMITSFLAQGYDPINAAIIGVYLHGLSGDLAASILGEHGMIASDIIDQIPKSILARLR